MEPGFSLLLRLVSVFFIFFFLMYSEVTLTVVTEDRSVKN